MKNRSPTVSRRTFLGTLAALSFRAQAAEPLITDLTQTGEVNNPYGLRLGPEGALYICEIGNHRISRLDMQSHKLTTVLDGQKEPYDLRFDHEGILYFNDMPAHQVRSLNLKTGETRLIAGTGDPGFSGDGGPAAKAQLKQPHSIAFDPAGRLLICDIGNHRIRSVDLKTGISTTFAGTGEQAATPEGARRSGHAHQRAARHRLQLRRHPLSGASRRQRHPSPRSQDRSISTASPAPGRKATPGTAPTLAVAKLSGPKAIACAPEGSIYIADTESHTIRRISRSGIISTVAGTGERGDGPVGDPLKCKLSRPHGVFIDQAGIVFISDSEAHRVRKIAKS